MKILDGFDFNYDERFKRRLKRKQFDARSFKTNTCNHSSKGALQDDQLGDGVLDDDYKTFLCHLNGFTQSRHHLWKENDGRDDIHPGDPEDNNVDGNGEHDIDPQYKMFLDNLRENGKSYTLEVTKNSGMSEFIEYEAQGGSDDEWNPQRKKKCNAKKAEIMDASRDLRNVTNGEKIKATKDLRDVTKGEKREATRDLRNLHRADKIEQPKNLGKITVNPVCHVKQGCLSQKLTQKDNHETEPEPECDTEDIVMDVCYQSFLKSVQFEGPVNHGKQECSSQKLTQEDNHTSEPQQEHDTEDIIMDECYQSFLKSVQLEGDCIVFTVNCGKRLKYEEDNTEDSDSEIMVMDNAPHGGEGGFTASVFDDSTGDDDWQCLGNKNGDSQFKEKLMGILRRPYNQEELDKLFHEVDLHKAVGRHRDLRGRIKLYSADKSSKSYLDHYEDLKSVLDTVRSDPPRMLNILRGFFYWLQNLSHEGAFKPWTEHSCLAVMPGVLIEDCVAATSEFPK